MKLVLLGLLLFAAVALAGDPPDELTEKSCQEMVIRDGSGLAQLRWVHNVTREQWDATPFAPGLPEWYMDMINAWFADALAWEGDPQDWVNHLLKSCRGMSRS